MCWIKKLFTGGKIVNSTTRVYSQFLKNLIWLESCEKTKKKIDSNSTHYCNFNMVCMLWQKNVAQSHTEYVELFQSPFIVCLGKKYVYKWHREKKDFFSDQRWKGNSISST